MGIRADAGVSVIFAENMTLCGTGLLGSLFEWSEHGRGCPFRCPDGRSRPLPYALCDRMSNYK